MIPDGVTGWPVKSTGRPDVEVAPVCLPYLASPQKSKIGFLKTLEAAFLFNP
jgi:hypothetical protein